MDYNSVINGLTNDEIKTKMHDYADYLQGIVDNKYEASQGLVGLLKLDGNNDNQKINDVINNIKNFDTTGNIASFDIQNDGLVDNNDLELLNTMINTRESGEGLQVTGDRQFTTAGGYTIDFNDSSSSIEIRNSDGNLITHICGDPHVREYDDEGNAQNWEDSLGNWHYADDSTFILDDGTKLVLNSQQTDKAENIFYNRGIYITDGESVFHYGTEFGEGRNNDSIDGQEQGNTTRRISQLEVDANEWDAALADKNSSDLRNGVFVFDEITNEWAKVQEDGSLIDVGQESWNNYKAREGSEMLTGSGHVSITREQKIAILDGQEVLDFAKLESYDFGEFQTKIEDELLYGSLDIGFLNNSEIPKEDVEAIFSDLASVSEFDKNSILNNFFSNPNSVLSLRATIDNAKFANEFGVDLSRETFYEDPAQNAAFKNIIMNKAQGLDYAADLALFSDQETRDFVDSYTTTATDFLKNFDSLTANASDSVVDLMNTFKNSLFDSSYFTNSRSVSNSGGRSTASRTSSGSRGGRSSSGGSETVAQTPLQVTIENILINFRNTGTSSTQNILDSISLLTESLSDAEFDDNKSLAISITEAKIEQLEAKLDDLRSQLNNENSTISSTSSSRSSSRSGGNSIEDQIADVEAQIESERSTLSQLIA